MKVSRALEAAESPRLTQSSFEATPEFQEVQGHHAPERRKPPVRLMGIDVNDKGLNHRVTNLEEQFVILSN